MRRKKHADERLLACSEYLYSHTGAPLRAPSEVFGRSTGPVYLEIGAGKGGFAVGMVKKLEGASYFALERVSDCVVIAAERAAAEGLSGNLRFVIENADNLMRIFAPETVDGIFLNFSDPWSKKGYAKRRLTHARYLAVYMNLLKDGGTLCFKTDNVGLFDFSLEEIAQMGLVPSVVTRDLHASEYDADNVRTEYEEAFSSRGVKINMLRVEKPKGFLPEVSPELSATGDRFYFRKKED